MITFSLPMPPSTNALYRNVPGKGRVKTADYRAWIASAGWELKMQGVVTHAPLLAEMECRIRLAPRSRIDIDNAVKPLFDVMQSMGLIKNDRQIKRLSVDALTKLEPGRCEVSLIQVG